MSKNKKKHQKERKPKVVQKHPQKHHFRPLVKNTKKEAKNTKFKQPKAFN